MAPDRALTIFAFPGPRDPHKRVSARPGAVWYPTGGSGRFPVQIISQRAGAHGQVGGYGLRWPRGTYAISELSRLYVTLIRVEIAPRSCTPLDAT